MDEWIREAFSLCDDDRAAEARAWFATLLNRDPASADTCPDPLRLGFEPDPSSLPRLVREQGRDPRAVDPNFEGSAARVAVIARNESVAEWLLTHYPETDPDACDALAKDCARERCPGLLPLVLRADAPKAVLGPIRQHDRSRAGPLAGPVRRTRCQDQCRERHPRHPARRGVPVRPQRRGGRDPCPRLANSGSRPAPARRRAAAAKGLHVRHPDPKRAVEPRMLARTCPSVLSQSTCDRGLWKKGVRISSEKVTTETTSRGPSTSSNMVLAPASASSMRLVRDPGRVLLIDGETSKTKFAVSPSSTVRSRGGCLGPATSPVSWISIDMRIE